MNAVDNMILNSVLLISLKTQNWKTALNIANQLVEHDIRQLSQIENMIEKLDIYESDKNIFRYKIQ